VVPQGGRQDGVPVLREDVMMQRMPHMRSAGGTAEVDPFAPEHGQDYWFAKVRHIHRRNATAFLSHPSAWE